MKTAIHITITATLAMMAIGSCNTVDEGLLISDGTLFEPKAYYPAFSWA